MMTVFGAMVFIIAAMAYFFGGSDINPVWGLPFMASCYVADVGAAAAINGIESIEKSGEKKIIKARLSRMNKK